MVTLGMEEEELKQQIEERLPPDKIWVLNQVTSFINTGENVNSTDVIKHLKSYIKSSLLVENMEKQVKKYGEPVLTVEEVVEATEKDPRYKMPLQGTDIDLITSFVRGNLLKVGNVITADITRQDRFLEQILKRLMEEPPEPLVKGVEEISLSHFPEIYLPPNLEVYYSLVDKMMKFFLVTLFEYSKHECSPDIIEESWEKAEYNCTEDSIRWMKREIESRLNKTVLEKHNFHVRHRAGVVISEPTLFVRDNVVDGMLRTICLVGFVGEIPTGEAPQLFDKTYTNKKFYTRSVHDLKAPVIAYITTFRLIYSQQKKFPFNIKMALFPFRSNDEKKLKNIIRDEMDFFRNVDYFVMMNCIDNLDKSPKIITSAVSEKIYVLGVLIKDTNYIYKEDNEDCLGRLKIILFNMMDTIQKYKWLIKNKTNMQAVKKISGENSVKVEFGVFEKLQKTLTYDVENIECIGWKIPVILKSYFENKNYTATISEDDIKHVQSSIPSKDPLVKNCFFEFYLSSSCGQYTAGKNYYKEIGPMLKLALMRGSETNSFQVARAKSALPVPVILQKLLNKECISVSFGGIAEFGHHAFSYTHAREAIKIIVCILYGLEFEVKPLLAWRETDVADPTGVVSLSMAAHLDTPFNPSDPEIEKLYSQFMRGLRPPDVEKAAQLVKPDVPLESELQDVGMVARYYSKVENRWLTVKYRHADKVDVQNRYVEEAKQILRSSSLKREQRTIQRMVAFLLYLLFKKRRSDIVCQNCKVYEIRLPGSPFISALARSVEFTEDNSLLAVNTSPPWITLGEEEIYELLDSKGKVKCKQFISIVKDLSYNILFDGDENSPVDRLFKRIVYEKRKLRNDVIVTTAVGTLQSKSQGFIDRSVRDSKLMTFPLIMNMIPNATFNLDRLFRCRFVQSLVCAEEMKHCILTKTLKDFFKINPLASHSQTSVDSFAGTFPSMTDTVSSDKSSQESEIDANLYKMIDRTLIDKLLMNEVVILPAHLAIGGVLESERKFPYRCSKNWNNCYAYLIYKSETGIRMYNELWEFYKKNLGRNRSGNSSGVYKSKTEGDENPNENTVYYLKIYVKYCISVLEHCFNLKRALEDLSLLYWVKPKFLYFEAYFIMRDVLAVPCQPPNPTQELINYAKGLKKSRHTRENSQASSIMSKDLRSRSTTKERYPGSRFKLSTNADDSIALWKRIDILQSRIHQRPRYFESESDSNESENNKTENKSAKDDVEETGTDKDGPQVIMALRKQYNILMDQRSWVIDLMARVRQNWKVYRANCLREFEKILLKNVVYWEQYPGTDTMHNYKMCSNVYDAVTDVLCHLPDGQSEQDKFPRHPIPSGWKRYRLRDRETELLQYLKKKIWRNDSIRKYLSDQKSTLCQRPTDYYDKLTRSYTAAYNLIQSITKLQEGITQLVPYDWIVYIKENYSSLPDMTEL